VPHETFVFVYGSLMRGEANHRQLAHARFIGTDRTTPRYRLIDLGPYPAFTEHGHTSVVGELYAVDDETLARLDRFEGHPHDYRRTTIVLASGARADAYLSVIVDKDAREIGSGDWRAHRGESSM